MFRICLAIAILISFPALAEEPKVYFMTQDYQGGSDRNTGSEASPLATLIGVQKRMRKDKVAGDVIVAIEPHQYFNESSENYAVTFWSYYQSGQRIRFMSADQYRQEYQGQYISQIRKPHFVGCPSLPVDRAHALTMCKNNYWLHFQPTEEAYNKGDFHVYLEFSNIKVSYFNNGLFLGNRFHQPDYSMGLASLYAPGHRVEFMDFTHIGNTYTSAYSSEANWESYAAVAVNSWGYNIIANNSFKNIEANYKPHFHHGIYIAHNSSFNEVADNEFHTISGDAIKYRDNSNYNRTFGNKIEFSGNAGYHSWFCRHSYEPGAYDRDPGPDGCYKPSYECPSHSNEFFGNTLGLTYNGKKQLVEVCNYVGDEKTKRGCGSNKVTWQPHICSWVQYPRVNAYNNKWIGNNGEPVNNGPTGLEKEKRFSILLWLFGFTDYYF